MVEVVFYLLKVVLVSKATSRIRTCLLWFQLLSFLHRILKNLLKHLKLMHQWSLYFSQIVCNCCEVFLENFSGKKFSRKIKKMIKAMYWTWLTIWRRSMWKVRLVTKHPAVLDLQPKFCLRIQNLASWKRRYTKSMEVAEHGGSFGWVYWIPLEEAAN